jgi:hypothetical protein
LQLPLTVFTAAAHLPPCRLRALVALLAGLSVLALIAAQLKGPLTAVSCSIHSCYITSLLQAEGARGLARGLAANATLAKLVLCWNGLEAGGGAAMGEMLALNMGLKHLDLSHCRLGPEACLLLGEGLKVGAYAKPWF